MVNPKNVLATVGDTPERAYASGPTTVRHVIETWAVRALLAEDEVRKLNAQEAGREGKVMAK